MSTRYLAILRAALGTSERDDSRMRVSASVYGRMHRLATDYMGLRQAVMGSSGSPIQVRRFPASWAKIRPLGRGPLESTASSPGRRRECDHTAKTTARRPRHTLDISRGRPHHDMSDGARRHYAGHMCVGYPPPEGRSAASRLIFLSKLRPVDTSGGMGTRE
jgi:hypothetical protein